MAGLTREGFIPLEYAEIKERIKARLNIFSPGIDLSPESPDGGLVEIFSFELGQAWSELNLVYNSYNPDVAFGAGLRNIGMITGLAYGAATRSQVQVNLTGTSGTVVPKGSVVADAEDNQFATTVNAVIPSTVQVVAKVSGPIEVGIGAITKIVSPVNGWAGVANTVAGRKGAPPQTEVAYRNLRNKTVLRNFKTVDQVIEARLLEELGIQQTKVLNNTNPSNALPDGTPANTIHVTVGEVPDGVSDSDIARVILKTKGLGCPTFGSTTITIADTQDNPQVVSFSKATPVPIFVDTEVLFLDEDYAGSEEKIRKDLVLAINALATGEDVVWSRLFGVITPYSKAQVNKLNLSKDGKTWLAGNIDISASQFASTVSGQINIKVVN